MFVFNNEALLTRISLRKLCNAMNSIAGLMGADDIASLQIFEDTILIETEDVVTIVKLERQE